MKRFDVYYGHYGDTERLNDEALETRADAEDFVNEWIAMTWTDHPTRADEYEIRERVDYVGRYAADEIRVRAMDGSEINI